MLIEANLKLNNDPLGKIDLDLLDRARSSVSYLNKNTTPLTKSLKEEILLLSSKTFSIDGKNIRYWLSEDEKQALLIESGTLTEKERIIMKNHVVLGRIMLKNISFNKELENVPDWVGMHHEFIDGSGYPLGLKGDEIPFEVRLLTILDIFDALTTSDRPYRNAMKISSALEVLRDMADKGKIDPEILEIFIKALDLE